MHKHTVVRSLVTLPLALVVTLTVASCATPVDTTPAETENPASSEEIPADTSDPTAALPDWEDGAPPAGTDASLAWEALMGPEGEYAALASYQAVLNEFGDDVEPYATIREAEARHAEALIRQLSRMGVSVPDNPYLGLIPAPADLQTAAEAWAVGEVANVELYDALITQTSDSRLLAVFENLRRASADQHLPAFERAAENGGTLDADQMGLSNPG